MQKTLGVLGGGQLGRMLITPCIDLGVDVKFLDPNPECSVSRFTSNLTVGDFNNYEDVLNFGRKVDVLTVEIEHVNVKALETLEKEGVVVSPSSSVLRTIQDKSMQKNFYKFHNLSTSAFVLAEEGEVKSGECGMKSDGEFFDEEGKLIFPVVQKMTKGGYDGKGVQVLRSEEDLEKAFDGPSVLEKLVDIDQEIGVIVVRNEKGAVSVFPSVDMEFCSELNLVKYVKCPSGVSETMEESLKNMAQDIAVKLDLVGILAVEFFVNKEGEVIINEMAPRVHNSGHLTIEGTSFSQFEMHIRAIMGLPLPSVSVLQPSVMVNIVGEEGAAGDAVLYGSDEVLILPQVYMHWYGKNVTKPGRKMAHVTIVRETIEEAKKVGDEVLEKLKVGV